MKNYDPKIIKQYFDFLEDLKIADAIINRDGIIMEWWFGILDHQKKEIGEELKQKIGFLRQWLNEDRITEPDKMVTNEQIETWFN